MSRGGAKGSKSRTSRIFIFFCFFSCMELFIFEQQVLFRYYLGLTLSVTSNLSVKCPGVGLGVRV